MPKEIQPELIEKVVNDSTTIKISVKAAKWIGGILTTAIIAILSFSYGLYVKTETKMQANQETITKMIQESKIDVLTKLDKLEMEEVKPSTQKNYTQDIDIVRLYERVDSRNQTINSSSQRPEVNAKPPTINP